MLTGTLGLAQQLLAANPLNMVWRHVLVCVHVQDQWLETYAGYGRTDPDYALAAASSDENGSSLSSVE